MDFLIVEVTDAYNLQAEVVKEREEAIKEFLVKTWKEDSDKSKNYFLVSRNHIHTNSEDYSLLGARINNQDEDVTIIDSEELIHEVWRRDYIKKDLIKDITLGCESCKKNQDGRCKVTGWKVAKSKLGEACCNYYDRRE